MVRAGVRGPDGSAGAGLAGDRDGRARADLRAHRLGQDAGRVPVRAGPLRGEPDARADAARLRLAAEGAELRRGEEPARAAARDRGGPERRHPHRRHAAEGAAGHGQAPARRADHHARVALPDADERRPGDLRGHGDRDPGRDPRRRADQARRAPGDHAGAAGRAGGPGRAARRPVRHAEPARRSGPVHGRAQAQGHDRGHRRAQAAGPEDPRAGGVDGRAGVDGPGPGPVRGRRGHAQVDLAGDLPRAAQARQRAHLHADLRQQPARGGAAGAAAERDRRGADRPRAPRRRSPARSG